MFKAEVGWNLQSGVAVAQDTEVNKLLAQMQQWLWSQYQFPFLYSHQDVAVSNGSRYYNYPALISLDYPTMVETKWGQLWYPVDYGISGTEYESVDPDRGETLDPVSRWQVYSATQFEVWPQPATAQTLRFWGTRLLAPLVAETDVCDLDDLLIVLFAAAEKLKRAKQPDWQDRQGRAIALFNRLKTANRPDTIFALSGKDDGSISYRFGRRRIITVVGNPNH
jgi:hypothetical protein